MVTRNLKHISNNDNYTSIYLGWFHKKCAILLNKKHPLNSVREKSVHMRPYSASICRVAPTLTRLCLQCSTTMSGQVLDIQFVPYLLRFLSTHSATFHITRIVNT